jgi:hypothetical protein
LHFLSLTKEQFEIQYAPWLQWTSFPEVCLLNPFDIKDFKYHLEALFQYSRCEEGCKRVEGYKRNLSCTGVQNPVEECAPLNSFWVFVELGVGAGAW